MIGARIRDVAVGEAWDAVAGLTVGQDVSDRALQFAGKPPQFSLGKSHDTYGPTGPFVVSPDLVADRDDLPIRCEVNGDVRQDDTTANLIFPVPELVAYLSSILTLYPGDLIFTGTPAGVGRPQGKFLRPGDSSHHHRRHRHLSPTAASDARCTGAGRDEGGVDDLLGQQVEHAVQLGDAARLPELVDADRHDRA